MCSVLIMCEVLNMRAFCYLFFLFLLIDPGLVLSVNPSQNDDVLGLIVFKADIKDPKGKSVN